MTPAVAEAESIGGGRRSYDHIEPCGELKVVQSQIETLEKTDEQLARLIESMRNRLPLWATLALSTSFGAIGFLLGIVYFLGRVVPR